MPAVSVVMPVFNAEETLEASVTSILDQSEADLELIAIDDGSTDRSAGLLKAFARCDERVRLLQQGHGGIVSALNLGLNAATAPFTARMDADDLAHRSRLEKQRQFLEQHPEVGVVGTGVTFGGDSLTSAGYALHVEWMNQLVEARDLSLYRFVESPVAHPTVMFRADLVSRYGGYREGEFPEDYELWLRWMDHGVGFGKVPEPLLTWNDPPARLSRNHARYSVDAFYQIKSHYLSRWLARCNRYHPRVIIIGSGRVTRRRVEMLVRHGVEVVAYVDIDPKKVGRRHDGIPVTAVDELPHAGTHFVLGYVGKRGARDLIAGWLADRGYILGQDWLPAA